jgi:hypothetical protein
VAAHFATRDLTFPHDRAVWRLDWQKVHERYELPSLALLIDDLVDLFGKESDFTPWQLFEDEAPTFACMIEPPSLNGRIVAQAAVFTLCSDSSQPFDAFLEEQGLAATLTKFVIPAEVAPRLRDQLDLAGVDERRLFPDLDGVAAALRRYYA